MCVRAWMGTSVCEWEGEGRRGASVCSSVRLSVCPSVCLSLSVRLCPSVCLSACPFVCVHGCVSVCLREVSVSGRRCLGVFLFI